MTATVPPHVSLVWPPRSFDELAAQVLHDRDLIRKLSRRVAELELQVEGRAGKREKPTGSGRPPEDPRGLPSSRHASSSNEGLPAAREASEASEATRGGSRAPESVPSKRLRLTTKIRRATRELAPAPAAPAILVLRCACGHECRGGLAELARHRAFCSAAGIAVADGRMVGDGCPNLRPGDVECGEDSCEPCCRSYRARTSPSSSPAPKRPCGCASRGRP